MIMKQFHENVCCPLCLLSEGVLGMEWSSDGTMPILCTGTDTCAAWESLGLAGSGRDTQGRGYTCMGGILNLLEGGPVSRVN